MTSIYNLNAVLNATCDETTSIKSLEKKAVKTQISPIITFARLARAYGVCI